MRFPYFAMIWFVYMVLAGISMFEASGNFIILLILTFGSVAATGLVLQNINPNDQPQQASDMSHEKAKRGPENSLNANLLALLDDSDREILRQQIMDRLLDNIERSSDGELTTLDALLSEPHRSLRR